MSRVNLIPIIADELQVSRSEARRLVNQGAVKHDGHAIRDFEPAAFLVAGQTLTVGKRRTVDVPAQEGKTNG